MPRQRRGQPQAADARGDAVPMRVETAAAYELLMSLSLVAHPPKAGRWRAWAEAEAGRLSDDERRRLRRWFSEPWLVGLAFVALVPTLPEPHGTEELLRGIAAMPLADFLRVLVTAGMTDPDAPLAAGELLALASDPARARAFAHTYLALSGSQRTLALRALTHPEETRAELLALLARHAEAFARIEPELREERERAAVRLRELVASGPEALMDWLGVQYDLHGFDPVVTAPTAFRESGVMLYYHEMRQPLFDGGAYEPFILLVSAQALLGEASPRPLTEPASGAAGDPARRHAAIFDALADPARLRLLRLLSERPHYGQELAQALGMSGATVSHHITVLSKAGLIGVERQAHRTYFAVRVETLARLLDEGRQFALGEAGAAGSEGEEHQT